MTKINPTLKSDAKHMAPDWAKQVRRVAGGWMCYEWPAEPDIWAGRS
jgi:hypothetical protein